MVALATAAESANNGSECVLVCMLCSWLLVLINKFQPCTSRHFIGIVYNTGSAARLEVVFKLAKLCKQACQCFLSHLKLIP